MRTRLRRLIKACLLTVLCTLLTLLCLVVLPLSLPLITYTAYFSPSGYGLLLAGALTFTGGIFAWRCGRLLTLLVYLVGVEYIKETHTHLWSIHHGY